MLFVRRCAKACVVRAPELDWEVTREIPSRENPGGGQRKVRAQTLLHCTYFCNMKSLFLSLFWMCAIVDLCILTSHVNRNTWTAAYLMQLSKKSIMSQQCNA